MGGPAGLTAVSDTSPPRAPDEPLQRLADYAAAFAFVPALASARNETLAIARILDLFQMLCAPARAVFLPLGEDEPRMPVTLPPGAEDGDDAARLAELQEPWAYAASGRGFKLRVADHDGLIGALGVYDVASPDRLSDYINLGLGLVGVCALAIRNARNYERLSRTVVDLQRTMNELKVLRGLLPICACCKRIRDDSGAWSQVEQYVTKHSEATFSHGVCPACMRSVYGIEPPE